MCFIGSPAPDARFSKSAAHLAGFPSADGAATLDVDKHAAPVDFRPVPAIVCIAHTLLALVLDECIPAELSVVVLDHCDLLDCPKAFKLPSQLLLRGIEGNTSHEERLICVAIAFLVFLLFRLPCDNFFLQGFLIIFDLLCGQPDMPLLYGFLANSFGGWFRLEMSHEI